MKQAAKTIRIETNGPGLCEITGDVAAWVQDQGLEEGVLTLFVRHTSASLVIQENADPDVRVDMEMAMSQIVPEALPYIHTMEGPDDMPAHVKSSLMGSSQCIPVAAGRLCLGTWQGIYLCEHRDRGGPRKLVVTAFGADRSAPS